VAVLIASAVPVSAQELTAEMRSRALQPGEAILVTVNAPPDALAVRVSGFGAEWVAYRTGRTAWRALIGIDLDQAAGTHGLTIFADGPEPSTAHRDVIVAPRHFRQRVLKVAPDYVNPPADLLARITQEAEFMRVLYEHSAPEPTWRTGFTRPVADRANSSFGTRSIFNGEPRSPHAGTDFLSPSGRPVHAPAGGRIVSARELFFTGNTVVIDHGLGVFSMLAHLSRMDVHEGQDVTAGEVLGRVGATGRVTGPHLHWALRVGAARVDPLAVLTLLNTGR
jgi:hypothetical protein